MLLSNIRLNVRVRTPVTSGVVIHYIEGDLNVKL